MSVELVALYALAVLFAWPVSTRTARVLPDPGWLDPALEPGERLTCRAFWAMVHAVGMVLIGLLVQALAGGTAGVVVAAELVLVALCASARPADRPMLARITERK